jgi:hypothetical protein
VEQTGMAPLADAAARRVQALLLAADLGYDFGQGSTDYSRLYQQRRVELGPTAASVEGTALLPDGRTANATVLSDASGHALVRLVPTKNSTSLYYAAHVVSRRPERLEIKLLHLKTGRPLQVAPGPVLVKTAAE